MRIFTIVLFGFFSVLRLDAQTFEKELKKIYAVTQVRSDSIGGLFSRYHEQLKNEPDSTQRIEIQIKIDELYKISDENDVNELLQELIIIKKYPYSEKAIDILSFKLSKQTSVPYFERFVETFGLLKDNLKTSKKGEKLAKELLNYGNSRPGSIAPLFTATDINAKRLSLNEFRGKNFVLLDFWASWCGPCRGNFGFMKKLYSDYHSSGLEIIAISRDDDLEAWKTAIQKDTTGQWIHVSTKQNADSLLEKYYVWAIPVKVLIDRNGKIIGRWRGGGSDVHNAEIVKEIELLLKQ